MDFLASVALSSVIVIVVLIMAGFVFVVWQQAGDARPVLIDRMLRSQGERVAYRAIATGGRDFTHAVEQCVACQKAAQCQDWLVSGATDGFETFCPNAGFIQRVKRISA